MNNPPIKYTMKAVVAFCVSITSAWGQTINFTDLELKQYLINEPCVDTTHNGVSFSNDINVDTNGDNEIQLSEALQVEALELNDFPDNYAIRSLKDLNEFPNLKYLKIIANDSLERISDLYLDSMKTLWISDGASLKYIDISNLPGITTTLRIEGIITLDTLNIRNGTSANQFSLFYSQNIKYACIDSIENEIDEFTNAGAMSPGISPSFDCDMLSAFEISDYKGPLIYPNPTDNYIIVNSDHLNADIRILTITGKEVIQSNSKLIDVSALASGVYVLTYRMGNSFLTRKIVVK